MNKKRDLIFVLLWPILACALSFLLKANFFVSTLIFFGTPSAYLSWQNKKFVKKILLFSAVLGIPSIIIIDYVMEITGGWFIPYSIFDPFRLFGYVTIDIVLWGFLYVYFIAIFYEAFLEQHAPRLYNIEFKYLFFGLVFALGTFVLVYLSRPALLNISYFYLKIGILLALVPIVFVLCKFPMWYGKFFKAGAYFFFLTFIYEITALLLGQWTFPADDQFIGFVNIAGIQFPFEEFFFWIMLGALAVLSYYKFFDDRK